MTGKEQFVARLKKRLGAVGVSWYFCLPNAIPDYLVVRDREERSNWAICFVRRNKKWVPEVIFGEAPKILLWSVEKEEMPPFVVTYFGLVTNVLERLRSLRFGLPVVIQRRLTM